MNKKYIVILVFLLSGCASLSAYSDMDRYYCDILALQIQKKSYTSTTDFFNDVYQSINEEDLPESIKQNIFDKWSLKPLNKKLPNYIQETNLIYQKSNQTCPIDPSLGRAYRTSYFEKRSDLEKIAHLHNSTLEKQTIKEIQKATKEEYIGIAPLNYWFYGKTFSKDYLYQIGESYKIKVIENNNKGIIVSLPYLHSDEGTRYIFIVHNTRTRELVDGGFLPNGLLKYRGTFSYYNVLGARKTLNSFEYINLPNE